MRTCRLTIALTVLLLTTGSLIRGAETPAPLRFGRVSVEDPSVTLGQYQPLLEALGRHLERKVVLVQASSYSDMTNLFKRGDVQLGIMNAYSYIQISSDPGFIPIAKRVIGKESSYRSYIVVRNDLRTTTLRSLVGKTFAFSEVNSTTGYLLPRLMLRKCGLEPERDFLKTIVIPQHDSILLAVANRSVDAAAVASYVFDSYDKLVTGKMRILDRSEPIPYGPVVVRRDLGTSLIKKIRIFFLMLDDSEEGRKVLAESGFSGFVPAKSKDYDPVRKASALLGESGVFP